MDLHLLRKTVKIEYSYPGLEFMPDSLNQPLMVCRHRDTRKTILLLDRPIRFRGDGQLCELLPEHANIVRFQKAFHLFPIRGGEKQTMERVFGRYPIRMDTAPQKTTLQRSLLTYMQKGGRLRTGGGILLTDTI